MEELKLLIAKHARHLLARPNVVGVGFGLKETAGRRTDTEALVVLVTRKVHPSRLTRTQRIPRVLSETKTDVIEVGELRVLPALGPAFGPALGSAQLAALEADKDRTVRSRPARPGTSVGHYQVTAGTFGALVYDAETRAPLILSNNHVLANMTDGKDGRAREGDPIYQPGRYDGGGADDTIAHLERFAPIIRASSEETCPIARGAERVGNHFLKLAFPAHQMKLSRKFSGDNAVDAAVAALINPEDATAEIMGIGPVTKATEATPGQKIMKSGRTSGISQGEVRVTGASVRVSLGEVGSAVFSDQIITTAIAQPGDSGSLVVTEDGHLVVGLLSAGSSQATVVSRWSNIETLLKVTL